MKMLVYNASVKIVRAEKFEMYCDSYKSLELVMFYAQKCMYSNGSCVVSSAFVLILHSH